MDMKDILRKGHAPNDVVSPVKTVSTNVKILITCLLDVNREIELIQTYRQLHIVRKLPTFNYVCL